MLQNRKMNITKIKSFQNCLYIPNTILIYFITQSSLKLNFLKQELEKIENIKETLQTNFQKLIIVLHNKPTNSIIKVIKPYKKIYDLQIFNSNELIKSWLGPRIENLSQVLNSQLINIDNFFHQGLNIQNLLKVNEKKYKNYLDQYIKVPNSPDLPIWEIFTKQIKKYLKNYIFTIYQFLKIQHYL